MKMVCVGHATYDTTLPVSSFPIENTKIRVDKKIECGGGPASNAAYLLGKWGLDTTFVGAVGNDHFGQLIIKEFNSIGVNTEYIEKNSSISTDSSYIISNIQNGTRTILTSKSKSLSTLSNPIDIFDANYILVDGEHYDTAKEVLFRNPKAISILDAGRNSKEVINLGTMVDYVICSKEFAEKVSGKKIDYKNMKSIVDIYEMLKQYFKGCLIITLEDKGSFIKTDTYKIIPSVNVKAIDSTGAGDIFHGAFAYFISQGNDLEKSIYLSSITSAISVTRIGSRYSIPELNEVLSKFEQSEVI